MTYSQIRFNNKDLIVTPISAINLRSKNVEKQWHSEQLITIPTAPINLTDTSYKHDQSKNTGFTLVKIEKNRPSQYMMVEYDPKRKHALVQN